MGDFEPITVDYGDGPVLEYPYCDVCGRVLHDGEDTLPDKGTDGKHHWCSTEHTAEFMAGVAAWHEFEKVHAAQVEKESLERFLRIVREVVNDEIEVMRRQGRL